MSLAKPRSGLVLCRLGQERFAFYAEDVSLVEMARGAVAAIAATAPSHGAAKALVSTSGQAFIVDSLEIDSEHRALLSLPPMLRDGAGGSLRGFVTLGPELWPVLALDAFARFVSAAKGEAR